MESCKESISAVKTKLTSPQVKVKFQSNTHKKDKTLRFVYITEIIEWVGKIYRIGNILELMHILRGGW